VLSSQVRKATKTASAPFRRGKNVPAGGDGETDQERRYRLLDAVQRLMPNERVRICMRTPRAGVGSIKVMRGSGGNSAHFSGCMVCSSVWTCPVCAERIANERRNELEHALNNWNGGFLLVTQTIQHNISESCLDVRKRFDKAARSFKSGRQFQAIKSKYGLRYTVRNREVTDGENGWHVHGHEIWFLDRALTDEKLQELTELLKERWARHAEKAGGWASWEHGLDIKKSDSFIYDYVAKFGKLPDGREDKKLSTSELTHSHTKKARREGKTPWQLLDDYDHGDKRAGARFCEYAIAFKGVRQLIWSKGLRAAVGLEDELTDEQIAEQEPESTEWAEISIQTWRKVIEYGHRALILEICKRDRPDRFNALIQSLERRR
jgi:hypothetical protein